MGTILIDHFVLAALAGVLIIVIGGVLVAKTPPGAKRRMLEGCSMAAGSVLLFEALIGTVKWVVSVF